MSRPNYLHPYKRLSDAAQEEGDGKERQDRADWQGFADRNGFCLGAKEWYDKGLSAFSAKNWEPEAALGRFLQAAQRGVEVRAGDAIGVENWDRLARLNPWQATSFVQQLRVLGIHLADVTRSRLIRADSSDIGDFFDFILETSRGHSESRTKSLRVGEAWKNRKDLARQGKLILTKKLPSWVEVVPCNADDPDAKLVGKPKDGRFAKLRLKEPAASTYRAMFELQRQGKGPREIVNEMVRRGRRPPSGKVWNSEKVRRMLIDRRVIGELQTKKCVGRISHQDLREAEGQKVPNYFPVLIPEADFLSGASRKPGSKGYRGRETKRVNPFKGLLFDALTGGRYHHLETQTGRGRKYHILTSSEGRYGRGAISSFDFHVFETAVFSCLREIDPADIVGTTKIGKAVGELSGRLKDQETELVQLEADLRQHGFSRMLADRVRELEAERDETAQALGLAQHREAHPLAEAWGEQLSLLETVKTASEPAEIRRAIRARLRETIKHIWLLICPLPGGYRACAVQIDFAGEPARRRHYLILRKKAMANHHSAVPSRWEVRSFAAFALPGDLDLADKRSALALSSAISKVSIPSE